MKYFNEKIPYKDPFSPTTDLNKATNHHATPHIQPLNKSRFDKAAYEKPALRPDH